MKKQLVLGLLLLGLGVTMPNVQAQTTSTSTSASTPKLASVEDQTATKESLRKVILWTQEIIRQVNTNEAPSLQRAYNMVDNLTPNELTALNNHRRQIDAATWSLIWANDTAKGKAAANLNKARLAAESIPAAPACGVPPCPPAPYDTIQFGTHNTPDTGAIDMSSVGNNIAAAFNLGTRDCNTRSDASTAAGLAIAVEVLEGLSDIVHDITYEVVVVVGGGNLSPLSLIVDIPKVAAHAALFGVTFCDASVDSAEIQGSFIRLGVVHTNLATLQCTTEVARDTIIEKIGSGTLEIITNAAANTTFIVNNDNSNTSKIINNDNSNTTAIISTNNSNTVLIRNDIDATRTELRDLTLRTQIEAALAGNVSVAWYQIPNNKGGKLDLVRSIVLETINNTEAVGGKVTEARAKFAAADAKKAAGSFKSAYDFYRLAYNQATVAIP
ncbi:MAG: hypothetical protein RLY20_1928 [Verrucomicrobiota bacterium]